MVQCRCHLLVVCLSQADPLEEAQQLITGLYTTYYKRPNITIVLTQPRTRLLGIAGEVRRPGTYQVPGDQTIPTVTDLIKLAGGTNQSADLTQVEVRRPRLEGPEQNYQPQSTQAVGRGRFGPKPRSS